MPNFKEEHFKHKPLEAVQKCRRNLKDFSFGLRHIRVLSPWSSLQQRGGSMWAPDRVHRKEEGYKTPAEQVVMVNSEMASTAVWWSTNARERPGAGHRR